MEGFWSKEKYKTSKKRYTCISCGLYRHCNSPKMGPSGNFKKKIMIVGGKPTDLDDDRGVQFQTKEGRLLKRTLSKNNIDLFEDCLVVNAVRCYTDKKIMPLNIEACRNLLLKDIEKYKPNIIICVGNYAIKSVIGHRWKKDFDDIFKWRGHTIPDQDFKAWVCPVLSPRYVLDSDDEVKTIWEQDFMNISVLTKKKVPVQKEPEIDYITDLSVLEIKSGTAAFDYETTGLKPYDIRHQILCASVADTKDHAYAFLMPKKKKDLKPFLKFLTNGAIYKMAHNIKMEDNWTAVKLRTKIEGWKFCSMQAAHIIDNRPGITGLKFQTYVRLGIVDYDSDISHLLKAVDGTSNGFNKLKEFMEASYDNARKVMRYCALDSVYQYRIALQQQKEMDFEMLPF